MYYRGKDLEFNFEDWEELECKEVYFGEGLKSKSVSRENKKVLVI